MPVWTQMQDVIQSQLNILIEPSKTEKDYQLNKDLKAIPWNILPTKY